MDCYSTSKRSDVMRRVRSSGTAPEVCVRRIVHRMGYRYRLHRSDLPGTPDLVFPGLKKVILVHGCFWHQHNCGAGARPSSRGDYWNRKLDGNKSRDKLNARRLRSLGWSILVIWECQTKRTKLARLIKRIERFLEGN